MADSTIIFEAKKWIDGLSDGTGVHGSWRLETIGKKYRYQVNPDSGRRHRVPIRIRRFASGIPWALMFEAIKYLESRAPYVGLLFNGVRVDAPYRPTQTFWRRDESTEDGKRSQGTYTLIQDLIEDGCDDLCSVPTSSSCTEIVTTDWVWDSSTPGELPQSEQGVTYSLHSVNRKEDGTFDYALVKRTALTQLSPDVTVTSDLEADVTQEVWDNLYGTPDAYLNHKGEPVIVLDQSTEIGESVTVDTVKNPDCTYKVTVRRRVAKVFKKSVSEQHTLFSDDVSTVTTSCKTRPTTEVSRSTGTTIAIDVEAAPDGTYTNKETVRTERRVLDAATESSMTRRGLVCTTTDRSVGAPVSGTGLSVGGSVRCERTDGGLWNCVVTHPAKSGAGTVRQERRASVFETSTSETKNQTKSQVSSSAASGVMTSKVSDLTEAGTFDVTTTTVTEKPYENAIVEARGTPRATVTTRTHKNQSSRLNKSEGHVSVGRRIVDEVTPGGLINQTVTETVSRQGSCEHSYCEADLYQSVVGKTVVKDVAATVQQFSATDVKTGKGETRRVERAVSDEGVVTETTRDTTEKEVKDSIHEVHVTPGAIIETVTHRNQQTSQVLTTPQEQLRPGDVIKSEQTPGGMFNNTKTSTKIRVPNYAVHTVSEVTAFRTIEESTVYTDAPVETLGLDVSSTSGTPTAGRSSSSNSSSGHNLQSGIKPGDVTVAGNGTITRTETKVDDTGVVLVTTKTTKEHPTLVRREYQQSDGMQTIVEEYVSSTRPADYEINVQSGSGKNPVRQTMSYSVTDGGLFRVTNTRTTYNATVVELPILDTGYSYCKKVVFSYLKQNDLTLLYNNYTEFMSKLFTQWAEANRGPNDIRMDPAITFDETTCSFSGSIAIVASWLPEQAGTKGAVDKVFYSVQYTSESYAGSFTDKDDVSWEKYLVKTMQTASGRGLSTLQTYLTGGETSFSYNPRTGVWSVNKCVETQIRTERSG